MLKKEGQAILDRGILLKAVWKVEASGGLLFSRKSNNFVRILKIGNDPLTMVNNVAWDAV